MFLAFGIIVSKFQPEIFIFFEVMAFTVETVFSFVSTFLSVTQEPHMISPKPDCFTCKDYDEKYLALW